MDRNELKKELTGDEGRRARIYVDTKGKVSGGVGRNLTERPFLDNEIDLMLENDITLTEAELDHAYPWWRQLSENRQRVLANMCFNMGLPTLAQFKKFLIALHDGDYAKAAVEMMDSKWATDVGARAVRLQARMVKG